MVRECDDVVLLLPDYAPFKAPRLHVSIDQQ